MLQLDIREDDSVILVLGTEKVGKSTFINCAAGNDVAAVGHGSTPGTQSISHFIVSHPVHSGRRSILVDTPGFGLTETDVRDREKLAKLVDWLGQLFPPRSWRRLGIIYLFGLDRPFMGEREGMMSPKGLCVDGIGEALVIATTKLKSEAGYWRVEYLNGRTEIAISKAYKHKVPSFHATQESAWEIIDSISDVFVDVTDFQSKLGDALQVSRTQSVAPASTQDVSTYPPRSPNDGAEPLHRDRVSDMEESPKPNVMARLEDIHKRLRMVFKDANEYKRLLSCQPSEAQNLLDTFQSVLRMGLSEGHDRRNLIVATKRLSSKTGLYPRLFVLSDVQDVSPHPVAGGGYADIHEGRFRGENVCLKVIRVYATSLNYDHIIKTISREAILWGQLSHPHLLPFYGLCTINRRLSLVCPWAAQGNAVEFLKKNPSANRILLCSDIAQGLAYLHDNDIVHGDLKGVNILVDGSHRAYLADFGLSAVEDLEILYWTSQSVAASTGGTTRWQAPELFGPLNRLGENEESPEEKIFRVSNTKATDVYAWACVCYELLTGRFPFFEFREYLVMGKVGAGARPTLPAALKEQCVAWGLTDYIWVLMNDCWERDPVDRPAIHEVLLRLEAVRPEDYRRPREWTHGPAFKREGLDESDVPLTLERLDAILRGNSSVPISQCGDSSLT